MRYYTLDTTHQTYLQDVETLRNVFFDVCPSNVLSVTFNIDASKALIKAPVVHTNLDSLLSVALAPTPFAEGSAVVAAIAPGAEGVQLRPLSQSGVVFPVLVNGDIITIGCATKSRASWAGYTAEDARTQYGIVEGAWIAAHLETVLALASDV